VVRVAGIRLFSTGFAARNCKPLPRKLVNAPGQGWKPQQIVSGFLAASASFAGNHSVARQYLIPQKARSWSPGWAVTVVTREVSDDSNSFEAGPDPLWLRVTRSGRAWAFHASTDGSWWRLLRYFSLDYPSADGHVASERGAAGPVRVGFLAQSPAGQGCTAVFEHIVYRAGAPGDLRDGS